MTCKPGLTQSSVDSTVGLLLVNSHDDDDDDDYVDVHHDKLKKRKLVSLQCRVQN